MIYIQIISSQNDNRRTTKRWININHPIPRALLGEETYKKLMERHPNGRVHFWANASGKNNVNLQKGVHAIREGTSIFWQRRGKISKKAKTSMDVFENEAFADFLWGPKDDGQSYRWIFPLGKIHSTRKVSVAKIGSRMNYKGTFKAFRAVTRLAGRKERCFFNAMTEFV